jgi:surface polysaccharide O-acyltransferase-like enzyme
MTGPARARLTLLDLLRILASIAVVRNHTRGDTLFGVGFGLILFLVIMFALASSSTQNEPLPRFARRKAAYLLTPWLRWSVIFVLVYGLRDLLWGWNPLERFEIHQVFYGGHIFFWFLPFAVGAVILAKLMQRVAKRFSPYQSATVLVLLGAVMTSAMARLLDSGLLFYPYYGWFDSLPALPYGVALGQSLRLPRLRDRRLLLGGVAAVAILSLFVSPYSELGCDVVRRHAVAIPLACLGFAWSPRLPRFVQVVSTTTFGIYMLHPLAVMLARKMVWPETWPAVLHVGLVWVMSSLAILVLRQLRPHWTEVGQPVPAPRAQLRESGIGETREAA